MPVIWGSHNNSDIFLNVGIIDANQMAPLPAGAAVGGVIPQPQMFKALIDTGAQKTMISTNAINQLGLLPLGKILISGVGPTAHYHNGFLFYVAFIVPVIVPGQVVVPGTPVPALVNATGPIYGAEISSTGGLFDVLLGMDIIASGTLIVGPGVFSFSY
jgi:hypothetical protein